eukprot:IDg4006t1
MSDASFGDQLFLYFSGHAEKTPDLNNDEADGMDERIICSDRKTILDDKLYELLPLRLPFGARLHALFDCCYSGTVLDLPYLNEPISGSVIEKPQQNGITLSDVASTATDMAKSTLRLRPVRALRQGFNLGQRFMGFKVRRQGFGRKFPGSEVGETILISACNESQRAGQHEPHDFVVVGKFTHAFVKIMTADIRPKTYGDLLTSLRTELMNLSDAAQQTPQLSTSHEFDLRNAILI